MPIKLGYLKKSRYFWVVGLLISTVLLGGISSGLAQEEENKDFIQRLLELTERQGYGQGYAFRYIELIIRLQNDGSPLDRCFAARELATIGGPNEIVPELIKSLQDSEPCVRMYVVLTLSNIRSDEAIPALITTLQDTDGDVRSNAALALGRIRSEEAVPALITTLQDTDGDVRSNAALALGRIRSEEAIPALLTILQDSEDLSFRLISLLALNNIIPERKETLIQSEFDFAVTSLEETKEFYEQQQFMLYLQALQEHQESDIAVTIAFLKQLTMTTARLSNRYSAIRGLTNRNNLQHLASSGDLLKTLSGLALQEGEDRKVRYGAFVLLSAVNTPEALTLLNAHESDFLELVEANADLDMPFYLPKPLNADSPDPFDETTVVAAIDPYSFPDLDSPFSEPLQPIIPSIPQGANPGETRQELQARLEGKPAVCRFPWVAEKWSRC